ATSRWLEPPAKSRPSQHPALPPPPIACVSARPIRRRPNGTCGESVPRPSHLACASHRIFRHNHQYQFVKVVFSPCLTASGVESHVVEVHDTCFGKCLDLLLELRLHGPVDVFV